jgi:peptidoglycan/LPS O-acetylase OafA/YrhL
MVGGQVAMDVFFALSGFLITSLIVTEKADTGVVSLRNFYARRALRLLPALFVFLAFWLAVVVVFGSRDWITSVPGGQGGPEPLGVAIQGVAAAVGYLTNWFTAFGLFSGYVPLGHLWSLAVEEQFYLLWAPFLVMLMLRGRRVTMTTVLVLAGLSLLEPLLLWDGGTGVSRIVFGTDTRAGALLLGCAAGLAWSRGGLRGLRGRSGALFLAIAIAALLLSGFGMNNSGSEWQWYLGWIADAVGSAVLAAALILRRAGMVSRLLRQPWLIYLGQRSYALYLWHYVWATWCSSLGPSGVVLTIVMSLVCAELSWLLVEQRALALKGRLAPQRRADPPARLDPASPQPA